MPIPADAARVAAMLAALDPGPPPPLQPGRALSGTSAQAAGASSSSAVGGSADAGGAGSLAPDPVTGLMPLLSLRSLPGAAVPEWPLTAGLGDEEGPPEAEGAHPPAKAAVVVITSGTCATSRGRGDGALRGLNIGECDRYAH